MYGKSCNHRNVDFDLKRDDVVTDFLNWIYSIPSGSHLFKYHYDEKAEDFFFGVEGYPNPNIKPYKKG